MERNFFYGSHSRGAPAVTEVQPLTAGTGSPGMASPKSGSCLRSSQAMPLRARSDIEHRSRSVENARVNGNGRNLLTPSELHHSRCHAYSLAKHANGKSVRRDERTEQQEKEIRSMVAANLRFLGSVCPKSSKNTGVEGNYGHIGNVNVGGMHVSIKGRRCVKPAWLRELAMMQKVVDAEFLAESLNDKVDSREYWEAREARRVATGQCGFYKFAKMLGEGKLSQYVQDGYWQAIARQSKNQVVEFLQHSTGAAMYNLTEHMRRAVAISLDHRKNLFDASCRTEVIEFIRFLRGNPAYRKALYGMKAQMGFIKFDHSVSHGLDPRLLQALAGNDMGGVTKFLMCSLTLIGALYSAHSWSGRVWAFAQFLTSFDASRCVITLVLRRAPQCTKAFFGPMEAQASRRDDEAARTALKFLEEEGESIWAALAQVVASAFKVEAPAETWRNAVRARRFSNLSAVITSVDKIIESLQKVVELGKEGIQAYMHGMTVVQWRLSSISKVMPNFAARVAKAYEEGGVQKARQHKECAQQALEFFREGSQYVQYVSGGGASHGQFAAFQAVWKMVLEMYQAAQDYFMTHSTRDPPFVIHFIGKTGIGKSLISQNIMADVAEALGMEYNKAFDHYFRNAKMNFWEGYSYQKCVFYDDFLQNPNTRDAECEELIRIVNNAPYVLNMAGVESKGKVLFTSNFVLLTSNIDIPSDISIADVEAVKRRRSLVIDIRVQSEYADEHGSVDVSKLHGGGRVFQNNIYEFSILNNRTGRQEARLTDYNELVLYIEMMVREKLPNISRRLSLVPDTIEDPVVRDFSATQFMRNWANNLVGVSKWLNPFYIMGGKMPINKEPIEVLADELQAEASWVSSHSDSDSECSVLVDEKSLERVEAFSLEPNVALTLVTPSSPRGQIKVAMEKEAAQRQRVTHLEKVLFIDKKIKYPSGDSELDEVLTSAVKAWYIEHFGIEVEEKSMLELLSIQTFSACYEKFGFSLETWLSWLRYLIRAHDMYHACPRKKIGITNEQKRQLSHIEWALGIMLVVLGTYGAIRVFQRWKHRSDGKDEEDDLTCPESGAFASGDERTRAYKKRHVVRTLDELQQAQQSRDPRALDLVKTKFASALCLLRFVSDEGAVGVHGLLIGGKLIAAPYHLFATTPETSEIEVTTITGTFRCEANEILVVTRWRNCDLMVVIMPSRFPSYPKLVHHFVEQADICRYNLGDVAMLQMVPNGDSAMPYFQILRNVCRTGEHNYVAHGDRTEEIHIIDSLSYQAETKFGDCGAPLIWFHPSVSRKILGFHVAGSRNLGASNILTKELMSQVFAMVQTYEIQPPHLEDEIPTLRDGIADLAQMAYMGLMPKEKQFRQPSESEIIPSVIHGEFPVITKPAALKNKGNISPLELGVRKSCQPNCYLPSGDLETVLDQIFDHYVDAMDRIQPRVLTLEEGLNGIDGDPWLRALNMRTSPGFPYITEERKQKGKLDYVRFDGQKWQALPRLQNAVMQRIELARSRKVPETVFVDVLKDERREIEKVEAMKTRIFNTCPMDLNIAVRMYFGHLATLVMDHHVEKEIAVGINYHSQSWRGLYLRLKGNGPNWIAGDYSNYDKTFPRQLMMMVAHFANRFYNDGNDIIRETLMESLCNRVHLANRVVYFQTHGNPSGNVLTTIINSFGNMALMRIAWLILARGNSPKLELCFHEHVALSVYGDDNVATVSRAAPWFNMNNISKALAPFGVVYTPPKIGHHDSPDYIPFEEVTYLKRRFLLMQGLVLAPLPKDRIRETCNWIRKCSDEKQATIDNIYMAQIEMFHWGKEEFDKFLGEIHKICRKYGIVPKTVPWNRLLVKYMEGTLSEDFSIPTEQDLAGGTPSRSNATQLPEAPLQPRPGGARSIQMVAQAQNTNSRNQPQMTKVVSGQINKVITGGKTKAGVASKQKVETVINIGPKPVAEAQQKKKQTRVTPVKSTKQSKAVKATSNVSTTVNKIVVSPVAQDKQLQIPSQGKRLSFGGSELLARIDEPRTVFVVPLLPGATGANKLDSMSRHYSWVEWNQAPTVSYRSLSSVASDGVWYYRVLHDVTLHRLFDVAHWNISSKAFVAQKSHLNFSVKVPLNSMTSRKSSPQTTLRGSFILFVYRGQEMPHGEFWLNYSVNMGGLATSYSMPVTYEVKKGIFLDPIDGSQIHGIPLSQDGHMSHYAFSPALPDRNTVQEFVKLHGGVPTAIVRGDDKIIVDDESTATEVIMVHPEQTTSHHTQTVWDKIDDIGSVIESSIPIVRTAIRRISQGAAWLSRVVGLSRENPYSLKDAITLKGAFANYTGFVTVRHGGAAAEEMSQQLSLLPLFKVEETSTYQVRFPFLPLIIAPLLGGVTTMAIGEGLRRAVQQSKVVHKGADALSYVYDTAISTKIPTSQDPDPNPPTDDEGGGGDQGGGDEGGDDGIDPGPPPNPLPDVPDFDDNPEAPGEFMAWETTNRHFGGYVVDKKGAPIIKWMGCTYGKRELHVSTPSPKYYVEIRKPWDKEDKKNLACQVEIDKNVKNMYLLAQCTNWGDDSCGCWISGLSGATYMGTVARFGGLTTSRSVIFVSDPDLWNSNPVHFTIGQAKGKYLSSDEGRVCMFHCTIGIVADADIARKYLNNFYAQGSSALSNLVGIKGKGFSSGTFHTQSDYIPKRSREEVPDYLDPECPGFANNQLAWWNMKHPERAIGPVCKALPIAVEAGPIHGLVLARYDDANGQWQDVPYCAMTYTSLSSRWTVQVLMGENDSLGYYSKGGSNDKGPYAANHYVIRIQPPPIIYQNAYFCIELTTVAGSNGFTGAWAYGTQRDRVDVGINMPISKRRTVFQSPVTGDSFIDIGISGDTSRPTTAVEGYSNDIYVAFDWVAYIVKDRAVATKWAYFENDYANLTTTDTLDTPAPASATEITMPNTNEVVLYKMAPSGAGGAWIPSTTKWSTRRTASHIESWTMRMQMYAPVASTCPLWNNGGWRAGREEPAS